MVYQWPDRKVDDVGVPGPSGRDRTWVERSSYGPSRTPTNLTWGSFGGRIPPSPCSVDLRRDPMSGGRIRRCLTPSQSKGDPFLLSSTLLMTHVPLVSPSVTWCQVRGPDAGGTPTSKFPSVFGTVLDLSSLTTSPRTEPSSNSGSQIPVSDGFHWGFESYDTVLIRLKWEGRGKVDVDPVRVFLRSPVPSTPYSGSPNRGLRLSSRLPSGPPRFLP